MSSLKSIPRSSLRGLRTFCVAARYQSFRAAADELFITASAVSHQIKGLEEELGLQLFDRGSRELKLTDAGSSLYEELAPLIDQVDSVVARYLESGRRQSVRISVQPFFASEFFVPRLSEFTARHPDIDIQVGTSDESAEKHPADADLSVRLFSSSPTGYRSDLLFPLRMVAAGSPDFKKSLVVHKKRIKSAFPLIVHETRPKAWKNWSRSSGVKIPDDSKVTRLDSMIAVVRAAEQGIGAALVPVPIADLWFKQGSIVRLFKQELVADVSYYLVSREDRQRDPAVEALRSWILEEFAEQG
ncbi:MAG: LysR substrate-binding domain-containing protein [Woeseiaceae bacterium]|nr:LysR substrate-binding domain-containing protein [Woeseiaceae bacterium]